MTVEERSSLLQDVVKNLAEQQNLLLKVVGVVEPQEDVFGVRNAAQLGLIGLANQVSVTVALCHNLLITETSDGKS